MNNIVTTCTIVTLKIDMLSTKGNGERDGDEETFVVKPLKWIVSKMVSQA